MGKDDNQTNQVSEPFNLERSQEWQHLLLFWWGEDPAVGRTVSVKSWEALYCWSLRQTHGFLCHGLALWRSGEDRLKPPPREIQGLVLPIHAVWTPDVAIKIVQDLLSCSTEDGLKSQQLHPQMARSSSVPLQCIPVWKKHTPAYIEIVQLGLQAGEGETHVWAERPNWPFCTESQVPSLNRAQIKD